MTVTNLGKKRKVFTGVHLTVFGDDGGKRNVIELQGSATLVICVALSGIMLNALSSLVKDGSLNKEREVLQSNCMGRCAIYVGQRLPFIR